MPCGRVLRFVGRSIQLTHLQPNRRRVEPRRQPRHRTMNVPVSTRELRLVEDTPVLDKAQIPLDSQEWRQLDAYWRAANYLSVGQIYLYENPMLREPLTLAHVKPLVVGHWGTTPGQNFIYVHLNRTIKIHDLNMIYIAGPGHGGPALVANTYLEGSYSEIYPDISQDEAGMKRLFKQFSFPGGISSHVAPSTPGSIPPATPAPRRSTIPPLLSPASSATARPRPGRWRRPGSPTSFSTRSPTARCCQSCISTASRSAILRSSPVSSTRNWRSSSRGAAGRRCSSRATSRRSCTGSWLRLWSKPSAKFALFRRMRERTTTPCGRAGP